MLPTLLTVRETAAAMKISESAVRSLCDKQLLKVTRVGAGRGKGAIRIYESSIQEYIDGNARESLAALPRPGGPLGGKSPVGFTWLESHGYRWPGAPRASNGRSSGQDARSN